MKIFISADIEGVTGVTQWEETEHGRKDYEMARRQMSLEAAAACEAILEAGHTVVIRDAHNDACNILPDLLPEGAELIRGWMCHPASMMAGIDESFDAAMYIGYHSAAFTNTSPLAHTTNLKRYNHIKINDRIASEFTINSLWADLCGIPSIYLSGDEGICGTAKEEYPGIVTTAVKKGIGSGTWNMHPKAAIRQIKEDVAGSLGMAHSLRESSDHYVLEIQYKSHMDARSASWYPGVTQIDAHTVRFESKRFYDVRVAMSFIG